jgi:hypothetical protein
MPGFEEDLQAAVAADRELGSDYEAAVIRSLGERLDAEIDRRIEERFRARRPRREGGLDLLGLARCPATSAAG